MSEETAEVSVETLAGIAGAGGADFEIDEAMYAPASDVETEGKDLISEGINPVLSE